MVAILSSPQCVILNMDQFFELKGTHIPSLDKSCGVHIDGFNMRLQEFHCVSIVFINMFLLSIDLSKRDPRHLPVNHVCEWCNNKDIFGLFFLLALCTLIIYPTLWAISFCLAFSSLLMRARDLEPMTPPPQWRRIWKTQRSRSNIDGFVQDCSNSIANALDYCSLALSHTDGVGNWDFPMKNKDLLNLVTQNQGIKSPPTSTKGTGSLYDVGCWHFPIALKCTGDLITLL